MTEDEINKVFRFTNRRITELSARVLALQTLLQQTGVFSEADVEQRTQEMLRFIERRLEQTVAESLEKQCDAEIRHILEDYRGLKN
jgi:hypothetical protein